MTIHLSLALLALPAAQDVALTPKLSTFSRTAFTRIVDESTSIRGFGDRPALSEGNVAFLGEVRASGTDGIYLAPASGRGAIRCIAQQGDPIPNVLGENFLYLDNPSILGGVVAFTAGHQITFPKNKDGVYAGTGGPLSVLLDSWNLPVPMAAGVSMVEDGVFFETGGNVNLSDPWFLRTGGAPSLLGSGTLPGGGTLATLRGMDSNPASGAGWGIYSALVNHEAQVVEGVYASDAASGTSLMIANWETPMPGTEGRFESFFQTDTDGTRAVFVGQRGLLGFGGAAGVYVCPMNSTSAGSVRAVATTGMQAPGNTDVFAGFGNVAVDGSRILFEAFIGSIFAPTGMGIYLWRQGELTKVIDTTDTLHGQALFAMDMNFRGLDGNRLAFRVTFVDPLRPQYATKFGIYVATFDGRLSKTTAVVRR